MTGFLPREERAHSPEMRLETSKSEIARHSRQSPCSPGARVESGFHSIVSGGRVRCNQKENRRYEFTIGNKECRWLLTLSVECGLGSAPVSMRFVAIQVAVALGTTALGRPPDVVGRVGRPAHLGERLAAVVVGSAGAGKTTRVPPVQQAAAIGVPAADRAQALHEAVLGWLTPSTLGSEATACPEQSDDKCPDPRVAASHKDPFFAARGFAQKKVSGTLQQ